MATDRYSDDHKIVVGNGAGELEIEAGTLYLNLTNYSIEVDSINYLANSIGITSEDEINISATNSILVYAGETSGSSGQIIFSANAGDPPQIKMDQEKRNVIITTEEWSPSSSATDVIYLNASIVSILGESFIVSGVTDASISPTEGASISPGEILNIITPEFNINVDNLDIDADVDINISSPLINISGLNESGPLVKITNTGRLAGVNNYQTDVLELNFDPSDAGIPDELNNWIIFKKGSDTKGSIEGYQSSIAGPPSYTNKVFSPFTASISSDPGNYLGAGLYNYTGGVGPSLIGTSNSDWDGFVVYKSGNQDYGEWIEIGDIEEWGVDIKNINLQGKKILGIQEGTLTFVRNSKLWRYGPGTPMIVTNRPIMIGGVNYNDDSKVGEVLSFIGQVPTIVMGPVTDGDLLIPKDGENYCISVDSKKITLDQYRSVIGTAWSSHLEERLGFVNCAIGIK